MDREVHVGFVKDEPSFHELKCVEVHADEMVLVAAPHHPLAGRTRHQRSRSRRRAVRRASSVQHDRAEDPAAVRGSTARRATSPPSCGASRTSRPSSRRRSAWRSCRGSPSRRSCAIARSSKIPVAELNMPRRTLMIYREQGPSVRSGARADQNRQKLQLGRQSRGAALQTPRVRLQTSDFRIQIDFAILRFCDFAIATRPI